MIHSGNLVCMCVCVCVCVGMLAGVLECGGDVLHVLYLAAAFGCGVEERGRNGVERGKAYRSPTSFRRDQRAKAIKPTLILLCLGLFRS